MIGRAYQVEVPAERIFFRFIRRSSVRHEDFLSNATSGKVRRRGEDAAIYRGISVFESREQAVSRASQLNVAGRTRFTHVAEILIRGALGHACARTLATPGHWTIWGEPSEFAANVQNIYPVDD